MSAGQRPGQRPSQGSAARPGPRSRALFEEARTLIPGGVNSPVRAFTAVGGAPFFVARAEGCRLWDEDGNEYIDYIGSWGPMILGHNHPKVKAAIAAALERGTSFGAATAAEVELAREIRSFYPSIEMVRLVSSGTEATMSAIRLARGFTARNGIIKCDGNYHGHVDALLVQAGSGVATLGIPGTPGVPARVAEQTLVLPYNDLDAFRKLAEERGRDIACVIVEPVAANMGVVPPRHGYLEGLREITRRLGILLIFDEVITGFRLASGGAQELYRVTPDLTTLGKILGGGLPIGAYGGREEIMDRVAPEGDVYQAGTLAGNPLAMRAGIAMLTQLRGAAVYGRLEAAGARLQKGLMAAAGEAGTTACVTRVGSLLTLFFAAREPADWTAASAADTRRYAAFFRRMLERGVYLPPSQYEAWFVSAAHGDAEIDATVETAREVLKGMRWGPEA